jgi:hypothetical protein
VLELVFPVGLLNGVQRRPPAIFRPASPANWKTAAGKQPYAIALTDRGLMALAGLWENWHSPVGEWVRSFAIITNHTERAVRGASQPDAGGLKARSVAGLAW